MASLVAAARANAKKHTRSNPPWKESACNFADLAVQTLDIAGMVQQYTEALIQASYGALSLSPHVQVTEEVLIDRGSLPQDSNYSYYETPARAALEARGLQYWMYLQLVPLAYHRRPPHRAWSGGVTSKGAVITQVGALGTPSLISLQLCNAPAACTVDGAGGEICSAFLRLVLFTSLHRFLPCVCQKGKH